MAATVSAALCLDVTETLLLAIRVLGKEVSIVINLISFILKSFYAPVGCKTAGTCYTISIAGVEQR